MSHETRDDVRPSGDESDVRGRAQGPRRPYTPPQLTSFGDVRSLTLGGSPGMGDTQNPTTEGEIAYYGDYVIAP